MQRIMIFGRPGSGKSTFALWLHKETGYPLHHLDQHFYIENWIERDYKEFLTIQHNMVNQSEWIIDGNSIRSLEMRYSHADVCYYFNYPRYICLWRVLKRLFYKNSEMNDRAEGCKERVSWKLIKYLWTFEDRVEDKIRELRKKYPEVQFMEVKGDEDLLVIKQMIKR